MLISMYLFQNIFIKNGLSSYDLFEEFFSHIFHSHLLPILRYSSTDLRQIQTKDIIGDNFHA